MGSSVSMKPALFHAALRLTACAAGTAAAAPGPPADVVTGLDAEDFAARMNARDALLKWARTKPAPAKDWLFQRAFQDAEPEVRRRCLEVLRELVLDDYLKEGKGYAGILMQTQQVQVPGDAGRRFAVRVSLVVKGGPAARAGVTAGDLIVGLGDLVWRDPAPDRAFSDQIQKKRPGETVTLKLLRNGKVESVAVRLTRRPPEGGQDPWLGGWPDLERIENQAKESYFQDWLAARKARK